MRNMSETSSFQLILNTVDQFLSHLKNLGRESVPYPDQSIPEDEHRLYRNILDALSTEHYKPMIAEYLSQTPENGHDKAFLEPNLISFFTSWLAIQEKPVDTTFTFCWAIECGFFKLARIMENNKPIHYKRLLHAIILENLAPEFVGSLIEYMKINHVFIEYTAAIGLALDKNDQALAIALMNHMDLKKDSGSIFNVIDAWLFRRPKKTSTIELFNWSLHKGLLPITGLLDMDIATDCFPTLRANIQQDMHSAFNSNLIDHLKYNKIQNSEQSFKKYIQCIKLALHYQRIDWAKDLLEGVQLKKAFVHIFKFALRSGATDIVNFLLERKETTEAEKSKALEIVSEIQSEKKDKTRSYTGIVPETVPEIVIDVAPHQKKKPENDRNKFFFTPGKTFLEVPFASTPGKNW